jgi:hypothetical protein
LIPRNDYDVSFWVEVILGKYRYGQPTNRYLQDLADQGLPVSPGTVDRDKGAGKIIVY